MPKPRCSEVTPVFSTGSAAGAAMAAEAARKAVRRDAVVNFILEVDWMLVVGMCGRVDWMAFVLEDKEFSSVICFEGGTLGEAK